MQSVVCMELIVLFSILSYIHFSNLTSVCLTQPTVLHLFPTNSLTLLRVSVALGIYLTLEGLQSDGCERVSREEEKAWRTCQAVNRWRQSGQFCRYGVLMSKMIFVWPVTTEKKPGSQPTAWGNLQTMLTFCTSKCGLGKGQRGFWAWSKWSLLLSSRGVLSVMLRRQAAWDKWHHVLLVSLPICGWTRHWRMTNIAVSVHVTLPCAFGLLSKV